jgi:hypothetical protein
MFKHTRNLVSMAALLAFAAACSDLTGTSGLVLAGTWQGSAILPNGYTTVFSLSQNGNAASGTIRISGVIGANTPITGQVNSSDRTYVWTAARGCELWGGVMNVSQDGEEMTGPVLIDRSGCVPAQNNGSGKISLVRQ